MRVFQLLRPGVVLSHTSFIEQTISPAYDFTEVPLMFSWMSWFLFTFRE